MVINKIGQQHIDYGTNCQDYGFEKNGVKVVCDGCSEGKHSEVGAKAFCHLFQYGEYTEEKPIDTIFEKLVEVFGQTSASIRDYLCFTILMVVESAEEFIVVYCGDGFIIEERNNGQIEIEELSDGEYPKYYAYNYVDKESLKYYKEGVQLQTRIFPKSEYKNIGVASDGIRFAIARADIFEQFIGVLHNGKEAAVKRFINRNQTIFKDDTTIVF